MTDQIFEVPRQALSPGTRPRACLLFPRAPITPPARPHAHPEAVRSTRYGRTARGCAVTEVRARCGPDRLFENRGPSIEFESTNTHSASARRALRPAPQVCVELQELLAGRVGHQSSFRRAAKTSSGLRLVIQANRLRSSGS
jgi:hypothetical protein